MPQTYQIKAPDGNWLEVDSDAPPTDAQALAVVRAYGDSVAARAQQKAQDMSTPGGILKRTATAAGSAVMDALNPMNYWRAEQAKTQELKDQQAARQRGDAPPDWRNLDPKPAGPPQTIGEGLGSLSDPDVGGRVIGQLGLGLVLPRVAAKVPPAMEGTGNLITRRAVAMNPAVTEAIGGAVGGIVDDNTWRGVTAGRAVGKAAPDVLAGAGRLLTKGGRMLGGVPATEPSTLPSPGNPIPAQDLQAMLEELRQPEPTPSVQAPPERTVTAGGRPSVTAQEYADIKQGSPGAGAHAGAPESAYAPNPVSEPAGPPPRLVKGGGPSLHDALITALEDVRQEGSGAGTTPPDVTLTEAGKPSVPPERYQEMQDLEKRAQAQAAARPAPAAAEPPPVAETEAPLPTQSVVPPPAAEAPAAPSEPPSTLREQLVASLEKNAPQPAPVEGAEPPAREAVTNPWERLSTAEELAQTGELHHNNADIHAKLLQDGNGAPYTLELTEQGNRQTIPLNTTDRVNASYAAVERFNTALDKVREARAAARGEGVTATEGVKPVAEPTTRTPSPAELTPDEVRRKEIGARDFAAEQKRESGVTETPDEVRARTRARTTGQTEQVSTLSTKALNRVVGTLKDMIANGATDAELRDYINRAPGDTAKKAIGVAVNTLLHGTGRDVVGIAGATALTGAALRQALVGQLQGNDKQEQD